MANTPSALRLRKHADKSRRNPDGSYGLAGVSFEDEAPDVIVLPDNKITEGKSEGWISTTGDSPVMRPAGPSMDDWQSSHSGLPHFFLHLDTVTFHMIDGDYDYRVVHNPDKYADYAEASFPDQVKKFKADDKTKVTPEIYEAGATRVDHFYRLERV